MIILTKSMEQIRQGSLLYHSKLGFILVAGMRKVSFGVVKYEKGVKLEELLRTRLYFVPFDLVTVVNIDFIDKDKMFTAVMKLHLMDIMPKDLLDDWNFAEQTGYHIKQARELKEHDFIDVRTLYSYDNRDRYFLERVKKGFMLRICYDKNTVKEDERETIVLPIKPDVSFLVPTNPIIRLRPKKYASGACISISNSQLRFIYSYSAFKGAVISSLPDDRVFDYMLPHLFIGTNLRPQDFVFSSPNKKVKLIETIRKKYPYDKNALYKYIKEKTRMEKGLYGYIVSFEELHSKFYIPRKSSYEKLLHTIEYLILLDYRHYS